MTNKLLAGLKDCALSVFLCGPDSIHGPGHFTYWWLEEHGHGRKLIDTDGL